MARRPEVFRALGAGDPPAEVETAGRPWRLLRVLKHDSWAATAVYHGDGGEKIVVKFNRTHPLPGGVPAGWLGRRLAEREARVFRMMEGWPGFPRWTGPVIIEGVECPSAVGHHWIEGEPWSPSARVGDGFFPELSGMLEAFHARGFAYVDMSKWGNILVGADGRPHLLDYQICFPGGRGPVTRWIAKRLQAGDRYYLRRHWRRCRPDQVPAAQTDGWSDEPPHIWLAERAGPFFRGIRILVLKLHGVRGDPRKEESSAALPARDKS